MKSVTNIEECEKSKVKRNVIIFIISRMDLAAMVIPVIVKIWQLANLDFNQMLLLQGIFSVAIVLFEIPSGAISDTFKRKTVLIAGYFMLALSSFIYYLGHSFAVFAIAETIFGIGLATISGSDTSLVYDSLALMKQEKQYKKIVGRASTLMFLSAMISLPLSGLIAMYNLYLPLLIISMSFMVKAILFMFAVEPIRKKSQNPSSATKSSLNILIRTRYLIAIFVATLSFTVLGRVGFWAFQPKLFDNGITSFQIGLIFAGMNLLAAIGSIVFTRIKEKHEELLLFLFLLLEVLNTFILWYFDSLVILSTMMLLQFSRGGRTPIISTMIQRKATSDLRATLNSMFSAFGNLSYFMLSLFFTIMDLKISPILFVTLIGQFVVSLLYMTMVWSNNNKVDEKKEN
ncbi:MAG: MFS transporter [Candidatus Heimdallarchaeaceae archaeon]